MALTPRQMAVIKARARAKKAKPAAEMQRPTALGGLGYQPEEEASRQAFRQGAANVAVPSAGPQQPKAPTRLSAAAGQFAQSATLGQAPNILAAPYALTGQFPEAKAFYQQRLMQGAEKFPVTTGAADIAGFLAPGGAVLKGVTTLARPVTRAVQTAPAIVRGGAKVVGGAGLGATEGALYGATVQAERQAMEQGQAAPTMQQRGEAAVPAAAMGAAVGGALPIVGKALAPVGTAIAGQAVKAFGPGATARQAERVAQKAVRADLQRAGINNLNDFLKAAEQYQGKPAMTGEIAQSTLNTLTALVRGKGTTGDKVQAILADRVAGFPARMMRDLEASTGLKADEILGDIDAMVKAGRETATPQYDIAKAAPFRVSEKLKSLIDRSPTVQQAVEAARGVIADKAAAAGKSVDEIPPLEFYDEVKQQIDRIEFSGRKMGDRETRQIDEVRRAFVQALDEIVPGAYAQARKAGGEAPKIREAVKLGQNSYTKPLEQVVSDIAGMEEPALKAYRGAFVTNLVNKIRMGQLKPAALRSPNLRDKMATLFGEDAADQLVTKFSQEFDLLKKGSRLDPNVGSVTSQALLGAPDQALDDLLNAGSAAVEFAQNLSRGNWFGMGGQILNYFRRAGYTEAQLNAIGDLLASDPQRAARILFPNEMARLGATPGGAAATNVLANPTQPPSGGRNTLAMPPEVGGAFVGGALGATQGETPEERARNALLGAAGGAVGGRMARGMTPDKTRMGSNLGNVLAPSSPQGPKPNRMGFYSQLEATVTRPNTPGKATGEAWAAWLKSQPGVKAEELEATGVTDWLRAKEGQVSRADVENYVRNNGVQVEEITFVANTGSPKMSAEQLARQRFDEDWQANTNFGVSTEGQFNEWMADARIERLRELFTKEPQEKIDAWLNQNRIESIDQVRGNDLIDWAADKWGYRQLRYLDSNIFSPNEIRQFREEAWRDFQDDYLDDAASELNQLSQSGRLSETGDTKWAAHTLPGGANYTELLLKLPVQQSRAPRSISELTPNQKRDFIRFNDRNAEVQDIPDNELDAVISDMDLGPANFKDFTQRGMKILPEEAYRSGHWDEPNVLAHVRFKERTGPNGERILALEEVQSDWHQTGRERGYKGQQIWNVEKDAGGIWRIRNEKGEIVETRDATRGFATEEAARQAISGNRMPSPVGTVPNAPFKDNKWAALAMKRVVKYAADNGFDGVAWIPGNIQNGKFHNATDKRADFYDKIFVNIANDIGKKSGAKAQRLTLDTAPSGYVQSTDFHYLPLTPELRKKAVEQGFPLFSVGAVGAGAAMTGAIRPPEQKKPPGQRPRG